MTEKEKEVAFYVDNEIILKENPWTIFAVIMQWMRETIEDFIDYNENIISGKYLLDWCVKKGYITIGKMNVILNNDRKPSIQDLLLNYDDGYGLMNCELGSSERFKKAYQILAECISENEKLRKEFIHDYCEVFGKNEDEDSNKYDTTYEIRGGLIASYNTDDNLHTIYSQIINYDTQQNTMTKERYIELEFEGKIDEDISFRDEYCYLKELSFEEVDEIFKHNN